MTVPARANPDGGGRPALVLRGLTKLFGDALAVEEAEIIGTLAADQPTVC